MEQIQLDLIYFYFSIGAYITSSTVQRRLNKYRGNANERDAENDMHAIQTQI